MLRLTPKDDMIYTTFKQEFPNFKLDVIVEDELKSKDSKEVGLSVKKLHV